MHGVPAANALLLGAPDLGEAHFFSAFCTAIAAADYMPTRGTDPPTSANMRYEGVTEWLDSPLLCYGAACKYFVHPEFRTSKEELHSEPGVYTGPPFNSGSPIHCSVWNKRYTDVDLGCVNVDDRAVVARSHRTHPSHQPYNQTVPVVDVLPDASVWYDSRTEQHPKHAPT